MPGNLSFYEGTTPHYFCKKRVSSIKWQLLLLQPTMTATEADSKAILESERSNRKLLLLKITASGSCNIKVAETLSSLSKETALVSVWPHKVSRAGNHKLPARRREPGMSILRSARQAWVDALLLRTKKIMPSRYCTIRLFILFSRAASIYSPHI